MSPKNFRNISLPEPNILTSFINCGLMDRQMDAHMDMSKSRGVLPTMGQLRGCAMGGSVGCGYLNIRIIQAMLEPINNLIALCVRICLTKIY